MKSGGLICCQRSTHRLSRLGGRIPTARAIWGDVTARSRAGILVVERKAGCLYETCFLFLGILRVSWLIRCVPVRLSMTKDCHGILWEATGIDGKNRIILSTLPVDNYILREGLR